MRAPIMICLRCGYIQRASGGRRYTGEDRAHLARCDYTMTIRYRDSRGRISGGQRDYRPGQIRLPELGGPR